MVEYFIVFMLLLVFVPLYFGSLAIGIICIVLAIFNADDSGGTIGGGGLPWRL